MRLYICEKSSQAEDVAKALGGGRKADGHFVTPGGIVAHASGHILELAEPEHYDPKYKSWVFGDLPFKIERYQMLPVGKKRDLLNGLKKLLRQATEVVISTDADQEGEWIARSILEHCGYRGPVLRHWIRALDPESLRRSLANLMPGEKTATLGQAARARSIGDWALGLNATRAVSISYSKQRGQVYSIGRVQTPVLGLVVRRDREIDAFKKRDFYDLIATVRAGTATLQLAYAPTGDDRMFDKAKAEGIGRAAAGAQGPLRVHKENGSSGPPKLFNLVGLQKACDNKFGWSADKALAVAQELYDKHKFITYPRGDCTFLPNEQEADVPKIVANLRSGPFAHLPAFTPKVRKTFFDTAKITAHHAVIPTPLRADMSKLSADEAKCYKLIAGHYLACLMEDFTFLRTTLSMQAGGVTFSATGIEPVKPGWKAALAQPGAAKQSAAAVTSDDDDLPEPCDEDEEKTFPSLADGTPAKVEKVSLRAGKTKPPAAYTTATLLGDMENVAKYVADPILKEKLRSRVVEGSDATRDVGIGTPATRASIIKRLFDHKLLQNKGRKIRSTEAGQALVAILEKHLPALLDPGVTAVWEIRQEKIIEGKLTCEEFVKMVEDQNDKMIAYLRGANPDGTAAKPPPPVGVPTTATCPKSRKPVMDMGKYYRFEGYPGIFFWKAVANRPITPAEYLPLLTALDLTMPVSLTGFTTKEGKPFSGRLVLHPGEKDIGKQFTFWRAPATNGSGEPAGLKKDVK